MTNNVWEQKAQVQVFIWLNKSVGVLEDGALEEMEAFKCSFLAVNGAL